MQLTTLDVRQERQFVSCTTSTACPGIIASIAAFAGANPGHLYIVGDEPDQYAVLAVDYAVWYHDFVVGVLAADPTARFSPAGLAEPNLAFSPDGHFTEYAQKFYDKHVELYGVPPRVDEWRFHAGLSPTWPSLIDQAAAWSAAKGRPMVLSFGLFGRPPTENVLPELQAALAQVNSDGRIAAMVYWSYDQAGDPVHRLTDDSGQLTPEGVLYRSYAIGTPSLARESLSSIGDFNHDNFADFADHYLPTGHFWVHPNVQNGSFSSANWAEGNTAVGSDWDTLIADFTEMVTRTSLMFTCPVGRSGFIGTRPMAHSTLRIGDMPN